MAFDESLRSISLNADSSIGVYTGVPGLAGSAVPNSGKLYRFLKVTGKSQVGLADDPSDVVVGVLQNKPQQPGAPATVGFSGVTNLLSGDEYEAGDLLTCDDQGRAVIAQDGDRVYAVALTHAANAGELTSALLLVA